MSGLTKDSAPAEVRAAWADVLDSGKYEQGRNRLRDVDGDRFCCLGVLCDMAAGVGLGSWELNHRRTSLTVFKTRTDWNHAVLPAEVKQWAGLSNGAAWLSEPSEDAENVGLSELNDEGVPFAEIAALIRSGAVKVTS